MPQFEKYYGQDQDRICRRSDLVQQASDKLGAFKKELADLPENLQLLDQWGIVPEQDLPKGEVRNNFDLASKHAGPLVSKIEGLSTPEDAIREQGNILSHSQALRNGIKALKQYKYIMVTYLNQRDFREASKLLELMAALNVRLEDIDARLKITATEVEEKACLALQKVEMATGDAATKLEKAVLEAGQFKERAKEVFENSQAYFQNQAMTDFGKAFDNEASLADANAASARHWTIGAFALLLAVNGGFILAEAAGYIAYGDMIQFWRWMTARLVIVAFLAWFLGHFFRERRNFLHVAVANRHRRNLCNAYIAVSEKMSSSNRTRYLMQILPQLATLGKTGFITREDVPDMPGTQFFRAAAEAAKNAKHSASP